MPDVSFRMYFGERAATQIELERIEEITVEQEVDMAWEARIRLFLCLDETGAWQHRQDEFAAPFSRVRIELKMGDAAFVPLIDGPVASFDTAMDSQPGRSHVNLVVRDDSVLLNREEDTEVFDNRADEDVAREVFGRFEQIAGVRVEPTGAAQRVAVRRGTAIQFLRELARAHEYHAYVLPGAQRGQSIGCFLPDPSTPGTLPPLVLMGADRNLAEVQVSEDPEGPQRTRGRTLRLSDQQVVSSDSRTRDLTLMREFPAVSDDQSALRQLPPEDNDREDPAPRTRAATRRASYAYRLSARLVPGCYPAVLAPYQKVSVRAGSTPYSGDYLLTKVTHRITPSLYTQQFEAKGDSHSAPQPAPGSTAGGAGVSVSFSASLSIF
jgi:phage protein D